MKKTFVILLLSFSVFALAQEGHQSGKPFSGFSVGYGSQALLRCTYSYQILLVGFQRNYVLIHRNGFNLEAGTMLQLNAVRLRRINELPEISDGIEFGFNAGLLFRKTLPQNHNSFFLTISSGPFFVSDAPMRQTAGFIFGDYVAIGYCLHPRYVPPMDVRIGMRHISNLGMKHPNGGVNNVFVALTLYPGKR